MASWGRVLFSDESQIWLHGNGRAKRVLLGTLGTIYTILRESFSPGYCMVCGGISLEGKIALVIIAGPAMGVQEFFELSDT